MSEKNSISSDAHPEHVEKVPTLTAEQERKLYRKIDLRILPMLSILFLAAFLDRGNIGNAKLEGLLTQLKMTSNQYTIALVMFYITYCLLEPAANVILKLTRPSLWFPLITFGFGLVVTLMGLVKTYHQLIGARVCLGACEAGLFPGVVYFLTSWYPRHKLQFRIGLFWGTASIAGAFSGLLAYAISFMGGTAGLEAWSWIFILEGIITALLALLAAWVLYGTDSPESATFLTPEEKAYISHCQSYDTSSVGEDQSSSVKYIWKAVLDWQVWIHVLLYMSVGAPLYACALFLPSIINGFGYTRAFSQLLTVPPFIFGTIVLLTVGYLSDKYKMRSPFILFGQVIAFIGFTINITGAPRGVKYFGMFLCVAGSYSAFPGVVAWNGNNLAPSYKRAVGMAIQIGVGNFGGTFPAVAYRTRDEPRYILGHSVMMGLLGMGMILTIGMAFTYSRINASRDRRMAQGGEKVLQDDELRTLGDRAPDFRYSL